jgi:PKD repeat protein
MEGQDEMVNILSETDSTNIKRTFAGLSINGCMKMIQKYGSDGRNMADTWTVFGDPTIMVRTAVPQPMTVAHDTLLFNTDSVLAVYCSVSGARVTATLADTILATALVSTDTTLLTFPPLTGAPDTIRLVVTAYNMIPYIRDLAIREVPPPVVAGFTAALNRVVPGNTVAFADTSLGNPIYWQWHFPGGNPEYSTEQNPVVAYETIGAYDVKLVTGNGFTVDSALRTEYIVVDFPAGTGNKRSAITCTVHPNPSSGKFVLSLNGLGSELLDVSIFNMVGSEVYSEKGLPVTGQFSKTLDLISLPEGVYFLKIAGNESTLTKKLVVSR